jgi:hypothetical protein
MILPVRKYTMDLRKKQDAMKLKKPGSDNKGPLKNGSNWLQGLPVDFAKIDSRQKSARMQVSEIACNRHESKPLRKYRSGRALRFPLMLLFSLPLMAMSAVCSEPAEVAEDNITELAADSEAFRNEVRKLYEPASCFRTNFAVTLTVPGQGSQTASGLLRADNVHQRMRMILTEPNLGITLSWITIQNGMAYVSNPRMAGVQRVPLEGFELQSLGTNNIQLPFTLFQDVLYGRLPASLYGENTKWEPTETGYSARFTQNGDAFEYRFSKDYRVERILYAKAGGNYNADIVLKGVFYNTILPQWFAIQTYSGGRPSETMRIVIQAADFKAWCKDEYFPVQ